jgi:hypothetical protein
MSVAHRRPDGSFEYRGELYRLDERGADHFEICRIRDRAIVGVIRLTNEGHAAHARVDGPAEDLAAARAIAGCLDLGRGLLPLQ